MKGLLLKEWYVFTSDHKISFVCILITLVISFSTATYNPTSFLMFQPIMLCSIYLTNMTTMDENSNWNRYSETLPISRKQKVCEKYIISLFTVGIITLLSSTICTISLMKNDIFQIGTLGVTIVPFFLIGFLFPGIHFLIHFKYEKKMLGLKIFFGLFVIIISFTFYVLREIEFYLGAIYSFNEDIVVAVQRCAYYLIVFSVIAFFVSWITSINVYKKREF